MLLVNDYKIIQMSFQGLYEIIPKPPKQWSVCDVTRWLDWLNIGVETNYFCKAAVDGSIVDQLTHDDLQNQLGVTEPSAKKKLIKWFKVTLEEYQQFVITKSRILNRQFQSKFPLSQKEISQDKNTEMNMQARITADIIIKPCDQSLWNMEYCFNLNSGDGVVSIGRLPHSSLFANDTTVSNNHAKIWKEGEKIFIQDLNSKNGTYIKVTNRFLMKVGQLYEIGSSIFEVEDLSEGKLVLSHKKQKTPKQFLNIDLPESGKSFNIGRNKDSDLYMNDNHMSNRHTKIYRIGADYVIEDMEATNGTWLIISKYNMISDPYEIQDRTIFKVGDICIYQCFLTDPNNTNLSKNHLTQKCLVCKSKQKNGVSLSCRHFFACYQCLTNIEECVLCDTPVKDAMRVYT